MLMESNGPVLKTFFFEDLKRLFLLNCVLVELRENLTSFNFTFIILYTFQKMHLVTKWNLPEVL